MDVVPNPVAALSERRKLDSAVGDCRYNVFCHSERSRGISDCFPVICGYNFWSAFSRMRVKPMLYLRMTNDEIMPAILSE
jgi:hypothetical protein